MNAIGSRRKPRRAAVRPGDRCIVKAMRRSTGLYLLAFVALLGGFVALLRAEWVEPDAAGPVELTFTAWGAAEEIRQLRERVIAPLNAGQDRYRLHLIPIPSDYHTKLATMIAGDRPPDLFYLGQEHVPAFAAQGAMLDLADRLAADDTPAADLDRYYARVLDAYRRDGRIVGLPWIAQPVVLFCNRTLFAEAGVALPDGSWDWAAFEVAGRRLTADRDGDGRVDRWGFIVNVGWPPPQMWIWQRGGRLFDPATGEANLLDPIVIDALNAYAGLIHHARIAPPLALVSERGFSDMFRAGRVAMFMGGAADEFVGLDVHVAEPPAGPDGRRATFAWTAGLHVSAGTAHPDLAFGAWRDLLDAVQRWKAFAPRRDLTARLEQLAPDKAHAADVIRRTMDYMRTPHLSPRQVRWDTRFAEEVLDPLLRTGADAGDLLRRRRDALRSVGR